MLRRQAAEEGDAAAADDEEEGKPLTTAQIVRQATLKLLLGTLACAFFSDPMVAAVTNFSQVR